jgi:hypothetical protein
MKWKKRSLSLLVALVSATLISWPQTSLADTQTQTSVTSFRRGIATVILCGVGGAVLGISTLSFYGGPQNHVSNITTGLVLGLIGGGTYLGMQASDASKESASPTESGDSKLSLDPLQEIKMRSAVQPARPLMAMGWTF